MRKYALMMWVGIVVVSLAACETLPVPGAAPSAVPAEAISAPVTAPPTVPPTATLPPTETPTPTIIPTPTETPTPTPTPLPTPMLEVISASGDQPINMRAGPGVSYKVIGSLPPGQFAQLIDLSGDGFWARIAVDDASGWLPSNWIVLTGEVLYDVPTETARTRSGLVQAWENVNVRSGPGTAYRRTGRLYPSQFAQVIGGSADDMWWQISYDDGRGWVSRDAVQFGGDRAAVLVTGGEPLPPATATAIAQMTITALPPEEITPTAVMTATPTITDTAVITP